MFTLPDDQKPDISYPTDWQYKLVGKDEAHIRQHVEHVLGQRAYRLKPSHQSRTGRYVSLSLELEVHTEADRTGIFHALGSSPHIMYVI